MIRNVHHLVVKEFLHLVRDRRTLAFLILMPSILTVIFGYAIGNPHVTAIRTRVEISKKDVFRQQRYAFARADFEVDGTLPTPAL